MPSSAEVDHPDALALDPIHLGIVSGRGEDAQMRVLLVPSSDCAGSWWLRETADTGRATSDPLLTADLVGTLRRLEAEPTRWVWASTSGAYPRLLRAGLRVARCHDLALTEVLLCAHEGRAAPTAIGGSAADSQGIGGQGTLFDTDTDTDTDTELVGTLGVELGTGLGDRPAADSARTGDHSSDRNLDQLDRLRITQADQLARIEQARRSSPGFGLLVAAESAAALAAAEMGQVGLPWRTDLHDQILTDLLGDRPRHGGRPAKLQELANTVARALGDPRSTEGHAGNSAPLNVDSPLEILRAFRRHGVLLETTRARELRAVDHPAIEPLLRYKELARLHGSHGWAWRDEWVRAGRFRPEYVVGGVVSGRWATRGGGALQIPRLIRGSVVADPGWALVVADAGQLEPRILAALSADRAMVAATRDGDLYAALATTALGRTDARDETKIALLAAMYGAQANTPAMAALRRRFPQALDLLETAARTGEDGGIVRSALGRTCPPPHPAWQQGSDAVLVARSRARGRFTRNFVIQASAADWANVLVAGLRLRLRALAEAADPNRQPELVLFQHDEVVVHAPETMVAAVIAAITESGAEATRLVVGDCGVRIPLNAVPVASYADKP